jgi:hypothetical protein
MAKKTNATTAQVSATATATNNNTTANVVTDNNTKTATNAPKMDEKTINATATALLAEYKTITALRGIYATLTAQYGAQNVKRIFATAKTLRADAIDRTASALVGRLSFDSVLSSVWRGVIAESAEFAELAECAKRQYRANDTATARQLIADYYTNVDEDGAPLALVAYINDTATTIATAYDKRDLTATNAVGILRTALRAFGKDARDCEKSATHKRATNVRAVGVVVRAFNVVRGADGRAVRGVEDETATAKMRGLSVENWQTLSDYNNNAE